MRATIDVKAAAAVRTVKLSRAPRLRHYVANTAEHGSAERNSMSAPRLQQRSRPRIRPATAWKPGALRARSPDASLSSTGHRRNPLQSHGGRMPLANLSVPVVAVRLV